MPQRRTLDDDTIKRILTSSASHGALARQLGVSRSTISLIRLGRIYANCQPHLPRWRPGLNCGMCLHWDTAHSACTLGFPDPTIEGVHFARDCSCFLNRQ